MIFDKLNPRKVLYFSIFLMMIGIMLPLLMLIPEIDPLLIKYPTLFLLINFFAFFCQLFGFLSGIASAAFIIKKK